MLLTENDLRSVVATSILLESRIVLSQSDKLLMEKHRLLVAIRMNNPYLMIGIEEGLRELELRDKMIQEGILDDLGDALSNMAGGFLGGLKEKIQDMLLDSMKVSPDPNAFMRKVMTHFMKKVGIMELKDMLMGSDRCINVSSKLSHSMMTVLLKQIPKLLGLDKGSNMGQSIVGALGEAMTEDFAQRLALAFCKIDFREVVKKLPGGSILVKFIGAPAYGKGDTVDSVKASLGGEGSGAGAVEVAAQTLEDEGKTKEAEAVRKAGA